MRVMLKAGAVAGALCLVAGTARAGDGVLLVMKTTSGGGAPQTSQVQIEGKRMRAESFDDRGAKQIVIFDGLKGVMTLVDESKKTYAEMTQADADALGAQIAPMMAQMQEQLKNMPPEQRAQIEAMMKGRMGGAGMPGAAASKTLYKKTGTDTVGKWTCDKYEGTSDGKKVSDVCTVDPKALGFTMADFEVSRELAAFFKKLMPVGGAEMFSVGTPEDQGFSGVPVRSVTTAGGRTTTTEITEVTRQTFPASVFQAPAGYQKTDMMGGRGRGRR